MVRISVTINNQITKKYEFSYFTLSVFRVPIDTIVFINLLIGHVSERERDREKGTHTRTRVKPNTFKILYGKS